ncbi:MAG: ATP-binding protein [Dethiobacter sp.]|nr:ATP-binding protein [Dethiobacter sp.]
MKLKAFRVLFYRSILDSGWIDVDDITVIVGKNESGKTALLKALHKFNPFNPEPYNIDREWPRGHRRERSPDAVVVEARFEFTDAEKAQVHDLCPANVTPSGVQISKTYNGDFKITFLQAEVPEDAYMMPAVCNELEIRVREWLPTFIYMDDHRPFQGVAYLDQIHQRKNQNQLTEQDKTFLMILEMAGLNFDEEFQRASEQEKEQRMLDMNDASLTLTRQLADHWSQRKYQTNIVADGYHLIAFVSDEVQPALVPLNERSKGFQWFFSFDVTFLYETKGTFKNAIILLDEPGLHLHAAAQRDLLKRIREYAKGNQLIYTTHMPFMIDMERLDNICVCLESKGKGTTVSADFYAADEHARFPLQAALGLSMSHSLFVGPYNLVVEGITDFWLISTMAAIFRSEGHPSLDERIVITPAGGATKAAYVATMLQGQELNVVVLLDSDPEGQRVAEGLIKQWIMKDRHVLMIGKILGRTDETTIEDLFPADFYLRYVNCAYQKELNGKPLGDADISQSTHPQLVRRVEEAMKTRGLQPNSDAGAFNKGRPAKLLLAELPKASISDLPGEFVSGFERLFQQVNEAMPGLQNKPAKVSGT